MKDKHSQLHFIIFGILTISFVFIWAYQLTTAPVVTMNDTTLAERMKPVGNVYQEGDVSVNVAATATAQADTGAQTTRSVESIYNTTCQTCHAAGVAGAPKLGDTAAWQPRISMGIDTMISSVINGKGAMPPKGMCMDCADDELKQVVEYMVERSQ